MLKKDLFSTSNEFHKTENLFKLIDVIVWYVNTKDIPYEVYKFRVDSISLHSFNKDKCGVYLNLYPQDFHILKTYPDVLDVDISSLGITLFFSFDDANKAKRKLYLKRQGSLFEL